MISYEVKVDEAQLADARALFEFVGGNSADAVRIAINKTTKSVKPKITKAIRTQVRLQAGYVNGKLNIKTASRAKLSGRISADSEGLLLTRFSTDAKVAMDTEKVSWLAPPDQPKRGIRVKVKPAGPIKVLDNRYFYMVLPKSRALGIVRRRTESEITAAKAKGSGGGSDGGKIDVAHGPSVSQVFNTVRNDVLSQASDIYQAEMLDAMRSLLARKYP